MSYVGIDLGTTNSAVASYDGESLRLYKSPEQHDVTPSAIYFGRRGEKQVGARAYNAAARSSDRTAMLFKRFMGTSTPVDLPAAGRTLTPEECSAEILRTMFGYLPEELRGSTALGTVVTVPAAFNQMQKDATMTAAEAANIGRVALMQEPIAAVMSVVREHGVDGMFLVFDLGGGTLDIAVAESIAGRVSVLAHGGIPMCGGRDFDRRLFSNVVLPWLMREFDLPEGLHADPQYKALVGMSLWAAEKAKIELSQREDAVVTLSEDDLRLCDRSGKEMYLDVPLARQQLDGLISEPIEESIAAARATLAKAGVTAHDVERIAFIGGPTHYKPLRDRVSFELGIAASSSINPMTAVAEGAAVFAESIDWSSQSRGRKSTKGSVATASTLGLSFDFVARTPAARARVVARIASGSTTGMEFQIDSLDTGWSSGRLALEHDASMDVPLAKPGNNTFKVFVFDTNGGPVALKDDRIVIARTAAAVEAIPASHSIAVAARDGMAGAVVLDFLVREGDQLPVKGQKTFRAEESLRAGSPTALRFELYEGEDQHEVRQNHLIGVMEVRGSDFESGTIPAGGELVCDYEIRDSGHIVLAVSAPSVSTLKQESFYSRQQVQIDFSNASRLIVDEANNTLTRLTEIERSVDDVRLAEARTRLERAASVAPGESDPETAKKAMDDVDEARRILAETKKAHLEAIRRLDLDGVCAFFDDYVREHARPSEATAFDNLVRTAERAIKSEHTEFEVHLDDLRGRNFMILWRQDWFVVERFKTLGERGHRFADPAEHGRLVEAGLQALQAQDMEALRQVVVGLDSLYVGSVDDAQVLGRVNIVRAASKS